MSQDDVLNHDVVRPPPRNVDEMNEETFGVMSTHGSHWEMGNDVFVKPLSSEAPQDGSQLNDIVNNSSTAEEVLPGQLSQMKLLWPTSPKQTSTVADSIWSSPEVPSKRFPRSAHSNSPVHSDKKILTVEELEHEFASSSSQSEPSEPHPQILSTNHPLLPPPGLRMPHPPPPLSHRIAQPPPRRLPPHFLLGPHMGLPPGVPRGHFLPPSMLPRSPHHRSGFQRMPLPPPPGSSRQPLLPPSHFHPPHLQRPRMPPPPYGPFPPQNMPPAHLHALQQQNDFFPRKSRRSEYLDEMKRDGSGFMTQKEKEWVIRIQLLQLQSTDPGNEDYYYLNYVQKKMDKNSLPSSSQQSVASGDENSSDDQDSPQLNILALPHVSHEERRYKPAEFSGTLGKLSVSSVTSPRKSIDVPTAGGTESGKEGITGSCMKKKQALIVIEKVYVHALTLEDLEKKALALTAVDRALMLARRDELREAMFTLLQLKDIDESLTKSDVALFVLIMTIRKGKRLFKRMLPLLSNSQAQSVLMALLLTLTTIIRKDSNDQVLSELTLSVTAVVSVLDLQELNRCLETLLEGTSSTLVGTATALIRICRNEFGATLLNELLTRGFTLTSVGDIPDNMETEIELWYKWSAKVCKEIISLKEQFNTARPSIAALLHTVSSSLAAL